jgi:hypothetical protein
MQFQKHILAIATYLNSEGILHMDEALLKQLNAKLISSVIAFPIMKSYSNTTQ